MSEPDQQRVVIVTGAAGAMGSEAVRLLAGRGAHVLATDADADGLERMAAGLTGAAGEVATRVADIADEAAVQGLVEAAVDRWGGLDGLFNIAGIVGDVSLTLEATTENWDRIMRVNVRSVWLTIKHCLPHLVDRGGGAIVSTGSYLAIRGVEGLGAYGASKHAVIGLSRTVAVEYAAQEVRVNVVCPGAMDTHMIRATYDVVCPGDPVRAEEIVLGAIPQRRLAQPAELAAVGTWLILDAPSHLTGQVIPVDGGRSAA
ncbi:MAG: SDR family NAD(P)-dependent oxidoreductase [Solirubrobacteraceae bacterium]|nr:SDR family NAD(P)-dependent oxidoreductase [Solirubrobacteraceae bacterium]